MIWIYQFSGSLDDPQFSYGSIVWKAIKNVLTKIVTSPFRALGKLFGGSADNLDAIVFEAGNTDLAPPEQEKLKAVGEALGKRLGLALSIAPGYDAALDTRAIQEQTLRRKVAEEMGITLEPGQKAGPIDLTNPKVQKAIDALHDDLTKKGLLKRLASKFDKPEAGHYEAAQEKLTLSIEVKESDLQALAQARGEAIQSALTKAGVDAQRMHIAKPVAQSGNTKTKATQTKLSLEVNKQAAVVLGAVADACANMPLLADVLGLDVTVFTEVSSIGAGAAVSVLRKMRLILVVLSS